MTPEVQDPRTGWLGTGVVVVGATTCALLSASGVDTPLFAHRNALLMSATFAVMAAWEVVVVRVHRRNFDFARPLRLDAPARRRVWARFAALAATLGGAAAAYTVLTHYGLDVTASLLPRWDGSWYAAWFPWFFALGAALLVLGLPYAWLCEACGRWTPDEDELLRAAAGYASLARLRRPTAAFWAAQRSFLVKFYFLPLMVVFLSGNMSNFEAAVRDALLAPSPGLGNEVFLGNVFDALFHGMFVVDVALAILGYATASRLLDTHVRSVDATASGWLVALACYPPFAQVVDLYLGYGMAEHSWSTTLGGHTFVLVAVGGAILALIGVYVLATMAFGLRFSNMTHRGILSRGPYARVRHPAYAAKCTMWWVLGAPLLRSVGDSLRLGMWTAIYVGRALTEERHLSDDPAYRVYMDRVRYRFIPGVW